MLSTNSRIVIILLLAIAAAQAQVLAPEEVRDPQMRALQEKYRNQLKLITGTAHNFPYPFYFSRKLDLEEKEQKRSDQRSILFDHYQGRIVLKITGNYFASYSAELLKPEERARMTYESVMLPLLQAAYRALENADVPQAFAFEIAHHVRRKILGVSSEAMENVVLVLPRESAKRLLSSSDPQVRLAAVSEGETFLNAAPISFWPRHDEEAAAAQQSAPKRQPSVAVAPPVAPPEPTVSPRLMKGVGFPGIAAKVAPEPLESLPPAHDSSPDALKELQKTYQPALDRMVTELASQAQFVPYAPPAFVSFHNGVYAQLSVTTSLPESAAGSQYRLAALAFDQHIAHLIRPVLAYFKDRADFDGIDFSTTVRLGANQAADSTSLSVEFILPLNLLNTYANFDSTGQQLIDASYVLINGERVSLNLQAAEAPSTPR